MYAGGFMAGGRVLNSFDRPKSEREKVGGRGLRFGCIGLLGRFVMIRIVL